MNSAQPIRTPEELEHFKEYYQLVKPRPRNYLLIVLGLNTALRISDILELRWGNVYDFIQGHYRDHISITEQKTGKKSCIFLNQSILDALEQYVSRRSASSKRQPIAASFPAVSAVIPCGKPLAIMPGSRVYLLHF